MPEQWGQLSHLEAQKLTREMFRFGAKTKRVDVGVGWMNVTLIRNIVCASISITIGSSLYVGGILLVSAFPCHDRFINP